MCNPHRQAALFKAAGKIAYADRFAAALAKTHRAELITGDKEFSIGKVRSGVGMEKEEKD